MNLFYIAYSFYYKIKLIKMHEEYQILVRLKSTNIKSNCGNWYGNCQICNEKFSQQCVEGSCNKYIDNIETCSLRKGISIFARSAAYYNHLLIKTGLNVKYAPLREKDKIK